MSWLDELKPGDKVIVKKNDRCYQQNRVETVKTVGKKFISLVNWENETRFRVEDGSSVQGGMLDSYQLFPATKEALEKLDQQKQKLELVRKLEKVNFNKLSLGALKQIFEIIDNN